ncbi:hypothetical protein L4X63_02615 [Geomonas sp. Red32]|uniref:hypothetical protein n=1 Tax=Geomonas sp. Red32 TaxID=2912856 RepID=UPI00202CDAF2|nr:hypothetical protein [Geomonas sp. Red32]MCM0080473.1 hypothetical protein [Geomonas sp. Red32]
MSRITIFTCFTLLVCLLVPAGTLQAAPEPPAVAYTGVFLMGDTHAVSRFPVYRRNRDKLNDALRVLMKQADQHGKLPFPLIFDSDIEDAKLSIGSTLSLAFVVVRDDVVAESFTTTAATINKRIVNVGLVAILYDSREEEGKERNTVLFSFPLVGYAQRLEGDQPASEQEIDRLFVETAVQTVRDNLVKRLSAVSVEEIDGEVIDTDGGAAVITIGSLKGIEEGQNVGFLVNGAKAATGRIVQLDKERATVALPKDFSATKGMQVRATNMRASSDETFQVVAVKVSSKQAAKLFAPEVIAPQLAQWYSNFLSERGGKVVLPSRVGGSWDDRAAAETFSILDRRGNEVRIELPRPKYPVTLDLTGVASKVAASNDVNDVCLYKAWIKLTLPGKRYEKTFDLVSSKSLIKGVQSFAEKDELYDLLYQLTAKIAKEADI